MDNEHYEHFDEKVQNIDLDQGRATIFIRGPDWAFIGVSRAKFRSKVLIHRLKKGLRGPDVARGPYVAPSWYRWTFSILSCLLGLFLNLVYVITHSCSRSVMNQLSFTKKIIVPQSWYRFKNSC